MKNLKYFIIHLFAFCIIATCQRIKEQQVSEVGGVIENTINTTLNKIKANLTDPISISSKSFDFGEGEALSGNVNVSSLKINGIKDFVATEIKAHVLSQKIEMKISLNELSIHCKYWADISLINLLPLYGHGRISVSFDQIELNVQAAAAIADGPKIKDIAFIFSLSEATFDLRGLIGNPEYSALISNVLTDNFADFVNHNSRLISETISPIIETIVNSFLEPEAEKIRVAEVKVFVKT